jgi:hypothetical protein
MTITLRELAWTSATPRKEDPLAYDGLDPLLQLTIRLFKENRAMKELYNFKQEWYLQPITHFSTNDIEIERMSDGSEV